MERRRLTVTALIQARMSSSRLPGKVLADLGGQPMIGYMLGRVRRAARVDNVAVVTSTDASDDPLAEAVAAMGGRVHRGSLDDVLDRFGTAVNEIGGDTIVRLTGDCPLIDPAVIDTVIALREQTGADYASNVEPPSFPDGLDVECFTRAALDRALVEATEPAMREHVTVWMRGDAGGLTRANHAAVVDASHLRLTVDYPDDLEVVRAIVQQEQTAASPYDFFDLMRVLDGRRDLRETNCHARNEGLERSLAADAAGRTGVTEQE
ncbi:cytidylyltransferase domain-containing protein [Tsuneonella amylolytica]|uniref:cytidylyltransferase domain-containing protein n=1 Tax=Tsuneonella amylolytica TaxID=2338327 RepID=UPI0013C4F6BE|nr:glycosyltransferase family protein [Tsuneonella amylolytica]